MAKLTAMPSLGIVSQFKKVIDFYYWQGIPCARRWPVFHGKVTSPTTLAQNSVFAQAARLWNEVDPIIRAAYITQAQGSDITGRDLFTSSYLTNIWRIP